MTVLNWLNAEHKNIMFQQQGVNAAYVGLTSGGAGTFTPDFIAAATADFRCPKAMVEVTWASSAVDDNLVISTNDVNRIDRTGQVKNGITASGNKWAYLSNDIIADGSFYAMPELDVGLQMGWYGFTLICDGSGDFSPITPPWLKLAHDARSYSAILVSGDSGYNEYPVDFTLTYTTATGSTVQTITGNTELVYTSTFTPIKNVISVTLTISKWSATDTLVKITQFSGTFIELYKADDIIGLSILEETNSDTGAVPVGNVSSNELDLSLMNTERRFSFGNTDSPYNDSLKSGRKIRVWLGFVLPVGSTDFTGQVPGYIVDTVKGEKIGLMPYGIYWSKDWISSYETQETRTSAYDIIYRLSQKEFLKSANYTDTIEGIVDDVLEAAKEEIPELDWEVSTDTGAIAWDNIAFSPKNYMDVLKDIAEASLSFTFADRNGVIQIGSRLEAVTPLESYQQLDLSDYFNFTSNPKLDELVNRVRVGFTTYFIDTSIFDSDREYSVNGTQTEQIDWKVDGVFIGTVVVTLTVLTGSSSILSTNIFNSGGNVEVTGTGTYTLSATGTPRPSLYSDEEALTIPASGELNLFINWSQSPILTSSVAVNLTPITLLSAISESTVYAYGADVKVIGQVGATFKVSATGTPFKLIEDTENTVEDVPSIRLYGVREFGLTGNILINSQAQADVIAAQLLAGYGSLRQDAAITWAASTLISVGDTLEVVEFKSDTVETKAFFIIKRQSITYDGSLQATADLRRG